MILAGDIGGTKTLLALYEYKNKTLSCIIKHTFSSQKYKQFETLLTEFLNLCKNPQVTSVCLGIAGPIIEGKCHTTNLPWTIDTKALQKTFQIKHVHLLNDLEATAYGMLYLQASELVELNPNAIPLHANRAVIAAGTGLGEAILYYDGKIYHPIGSEGGHCDFAPQNTLQDELLVWLRQRHPSHVSIERILSGVGISTIYEFLLEKGVANESHTIQNLASNVDKNAMISKCALQDKDPLSVQTLQLFCDIYGAEAGNVALKSLAIGGIYIGGGIAPKILPYLQDGRFLNAFLSKGRFKSMLNTVSLKVSLNTETALMGAAHFSVDTFTLNT